MLACSLAVLGVFYALCFAAIRLWGGPDGVAELRRPPVEVLPTIFLIVSPLLGALIVWHQPRNAVGWLFIVVAGGLGFAFAGEALADYIVSTRPDAVGWAAILLWARSWLSAPAFASLPLLMLLFPDGRPPSRRWSPVAWLALAGGGVLMLSQAFTTREVSPGVANPFAARELEALVNAAEIMGVLSILAGFVLGAAGLFVRFRRAAIVERQQLKWFGFAVAIVVPLSVIANLVPVEAVRSGAIVAAFASLVLLPISGAIAILRYRLYDIDVLINRTLVYGVLTATLGASYVGSVLLLQSALRPFTTGSDIAVAVSTLVVVALFQPVRRRIQDGVDRRFYRSRYDAARTLDRFSTRLRDQVDLDALRGELVGVVHETVRPAHASLWLRRDQRGSGAAAER